MPCYVCLLSYITHDEWNILCVFCEDDVVVIQVDEQRRDVADFFVVVSGKSARHLRAMASSLATMCNEKLDLKSGRVRVEGLGDHFWTVVHTGYLSNLRQCFPFSTFLHFFEK